MKKRQAKKNAKKLAPKVEKNQVRFIKKDSNKTVNINNAIKNKWKVQKQKWNGESWTKLKTKVYKENPDKIKSVILRNNKGKFEKFEQVRRGDEIRIEYISHGVKKDEKRTTRLTKKSLLEKKELVKPKKLLKGETKLKKFAQFFNRNMHSARLRKFYVATKIQQRVEKEFKDETPDLQKEIRIHINDTMADWLKEMEKDLNELPKEETKKVLNEEINNWINYHKQMTGSTFR